METVRRFMLGLTLAAGLWGCATPADQAAGTALRDGRDEAGDDRGCVGSSHGQWWQRTELFFGLDSPSGAITEADFQRFVDAVVTPLFPDGLTVVDAKGQFRASAASVLEKEDTKLLILFYPFDPQRSDSVEEIRSRYKERFQQRSVLRVDRAACVSF